MNSSFPILRRLLGLLAPMRGVLIFSILMRTLNQALGVALLVAAVWGSMRIVASGDVGGGLWPLVGWLVGLGFVKGICRYLEQFSGHYVAFRLLSSLRTRLFDKLEELAPAGLGRDRSGDLLTRVISDIERIEVFYAHTIAPCVVAVVVPLGIVVVLGALNLWLAAGLIPVLLAVGALLPWMTQRMARTPAARSREGLADLGACFTDGVLGLRDVAALNAGNARLAELGRASGRLARAQSGLARCGAFQGGATDLLIGGSTLAALGAGAWLAGAGRLEAFQFPVVVVLVMSAFVPLLGISNLIPDLELALESARRIFSIFDREVPRDFCGEMKSENGEEPSEEGLVFEDVTFAYSDESAVLRGVSLHARPGEMLAIVGASGAGKSTLTHLLLRFWEVSSGCIRVFGKDIRAISAERLRERFAVVSQRSHVFQSTLRENLLIANPDAGERDIARSLKLAGLEDFVRDLPEGLDTEVGALGGRLSGGQRQRLAMARAFLKDANVLVFDEATSHLDAACEREARRGIRAWLRERPKRVAIVISHRLDSVRDADRIAVLDGGRVVEAGTHAELSVSGTAYRRNFQLAGAGE